MVPPTVSDWNGLAERSVAVRFVDLNLRGAGQVIFQDSPLAGLLFLFAVVWGGAATGNPAVAIGAVLGLPLVAARRSQHALLRRIATVYIDVVRAVPPITWLFLIYFGLPQAALRLDPIGASIVGFSLIAIHSVIILVKDFLAVSGRGSLDHLHAQGVYDTELLP